MFSILFLIGWVRFVFIMVVRWEMLMVSIILVGEWLFLVCRCLIMFFVRKVMLIFILVFLVKVLVSGLISFG